jgi:predicted Zn-ribbon and HTH transcriptional regulator
MGSINDTLFGAMCARCGQKRTRSRVDDIPTCPGCEESIVKVKAEAEVKRPCPMDGTPMQKEIVHKLVIDRCPRCKGVWLDPEELEAIKKASAAEGYGNGLIVGMAVF